MASKNARRDGSTNDGLMVIPGVGREYSDLLESVGVGTVRELSLRDASRLAARMAKVNQRRQIVRRPPSEATVQDWIDHAAALTSDSRFKIRRSSKKWAKKNSNLKPAAKRTWMPRDDFMPLDDKSKKEV